MNLEEVDATHPVQAPDKLRKRPVGSALERHGHSWRKSPDPLVCLGGLITRTVWMLCDFKTLLFNGISRMNSEETELTIEDRREQMVFQELLDASLTLKKRLKAATDDEVITIAELLLQGATGATKNDTKSLRGTILDWITPNGQVLLPALSRHNKSDRGFHHERTGALLCPVGLNWSDQRIKNKLMNGEMSVDGDQWPIFLYAGYTHYSEDPWNGLLRSQLLVKAYEHIFYTLSDMQVNASAGTSRRHGTTSTTRASIAYVAAQTRFALCSSFFFLRKDTITDTEMFYRSLMDLLEDPDEQQEVIKLLSWWDRQILALSVSRQSLATTTLAHIRKNRAGARKLEADL